MLSLEEKRRRYSNAKIWPTFRCTMNCTRCAARPGMAVHGHDYMLSWRQYTRFIERLVEQGVHLGLLDFSGGEPTLWPHLTAAIAYAKDRGIANCIRVMTNGLNRNAPDYGRADLVCVSQYGGQNCIDVLRLKRPLGRRCSIINPAHIDPDLPIHDDRVLPANCTCIRLCLVGDTVYPCAVGGYYGEHGMSVDTNFYEVACARQPDMQERCMRCFANYKVTADLVPPIVFQAGIWGSPYTLLWSTGVKLIRMRRWLARKYMNRLGRGTNR